MKKVILVAILALMLCGCNNSTPMYDETKLLPKEQIVNIFASPKEYIGTSIESTAKILKIEKAESSYVIQAYLDAENDELNTILNITNDQFKDFKEGQYISFNGVINKEFKGENMFGKELILPVVLVNNIEASSYKDVIAPTINEVIWNQTQDQHGVKITIEKVEFAKSETRVYVKIKNDSAEKASFYDFNSKLIVGSTQIASKYADYDADYKKAESTIFPGVETDGVIVFEAIKEENQNKLEIFMEAQNSNYQLDFQDYIFKL